MAVVKIQTLEEARSNSVSSPRTLAHLFSLFAGLALVIAIAGIASMLSLWVKQRTRETGIRIALGATRGNIVGGFMRQGLTLAILGLMLGMAGALMTSRLLTGLLFGITPRDLTTYLTVSVLLLAAAVVACYAPARRAAKTDPQIALRCE